MTPKKMKQKVERFAYGKVHAVALNGDPDDCFVRQTNMIARMVKSVNAGDLNSPGLGLAGSSPAPGTILC